MFTQKWKTSSTKKIATDSPTRAVALGRRGNCHNLNLFLADFTDLTDSFFYVVCEISKICESLFKIYFVDNQLFYN